MHTETQKNIPFSHYSPGGDTKQFQVLQVGLFRNEEQTHQTGDMQKTNIQCDSLTPMAQQAY